MHFCCSRITTVFVAAEISNCCIDWSAVGRASSPADHCGENALSYSIDPAAVSGNGKNFQRVRTCFWKWIFTSKIGRWVTSPIRIMQMITNDQISTEKKTPEIKLIFGGRICQKVGHRTSITFISNGF